MYAVRMGKKLNLDTPKTYNEKLQWLKLNDRNPLYTRLVDKYEVRKHVAALIGEQYLVPIEGVYNNFDEIDFSKLPKRFVLKCTHDSGGLVVCTDKNCLDLSIARRKINSCLKKNYYHHGREWPYKHVKPRIICEHFIETHDGNPPRDYKIFCFNGEPKFLFVASDRGRGTKFDFFDMNWNKYPLKQHYPNSDYIIEKPKQWDDMIRCARILSKGFPHVRVDFYIDVNERVLFSELTFSHFSGGEKFEPDYYDEYFGRYLTLPEKGGGQFSKTVAKID